MTVSLASLQKLMTLNLSTEQMAGVIEVLSAELAPLEARRSADRARKRTGNSTDVPRNVCGSSVEIPVTRVEDNFNLSSKEGLENPPSSPPLLPSHFEQFWTVYPERAGVQNRETAEKAFAAACKRADPAVIIAAAERYAADLKARGKLGTEFVKQARGWLNESLWQEFQSKPQAAPAVPKQVPVIEHTAAWKAWEPVWIKQHGKRPPTTDIRIPGKQIQRGWYFPTEFPPDKSEEAA